MGSRKCMVEGCNRSEFRVSSLCLKHKDRSPSPNKPDTILIDSSAFADLQSNNKREFKLPILDTSSHSSKPVLYKDQARNAKKRESDLKRTKTDISVTETNQTSRIQKCAMGFLLFVIGAIISTSGSWNTCFVGLAIIVFGWSLMLQSLTTSTVLKFSVAVSYVLTVVLIIAFIGFLLIMNALSSY